MMDEIKENAMRQLMAILKEDYKNERDIGRRVWGPKKSTLRGIKGAIALVDYFLVFYMKWLMHIWTGFVYVHIYLFICVVPCVT